MPSYKMYYFDVKGRAELARYLFALSGTDYEDIRFKMEDWPTHKASSPTGKCPYMEVDGKKIADSAAICRYLAKQFGYMGDNDWEAGQIDMVMGYLEDCTSPFGKNAWENKDNPEALKAGLEKFKTDVFEDMAKRFEKHLNEKEYLIGSKLSVADVGLYYSMCCILPMLGEECCEKCPNIKAFCKRIKEIPAVAKWEKERPQSQF